MEQIAQILSLIHKRIVDRNFMNTEKFQTLSLYFQILITKDQELKPHLITIVNDFDISYKIGEIEIFELCDNEIYFKYHQAKTKE
jgi:hypothetical protein